MTWHLQPLHAPEEPSIALPKEGPVTIGRRPGNIILCKDLAVSGQHCIIHCRDGAASSITEPPEVEDCSTNGSYVNEVKITKGQRHRLGLDDIISLTKQPEEEPAGPDAPPRVQFRVSFHSHPEDEAVSKPLFDPAAARSLFPRQPALGTEVPATAPDPKPVASGAEAVGLTAGGAENCFAQDLLVQEQQSKAKITAQFLQSQGKLEEEKQAADAASRELEKVRKQVAEERARRHEAEESRDRLSAEAEALRTEYRQLKELRTSHEELRQRHEVVQTELQTRRQKCAQLEASQEQLRKDLEKATDSHHKASQQHAELQTRARQAQERADRLQQQYEEAKREADWAQEQSGRIEGELTAERKAREELEEKVSKTKDQVSKAETSERTAREALDAATAKRAELECQASSAHSDLEGAKSAARQSQQRLSASKSLVEKLHEAGKCLSVELKRRAEVWESALADGNFDKLEDALASGGPTFAQITCQVESPPAKSQHEQGGVAAVANGHEQQNSIAAVAPQIESGNRKASDDEHHSAPHAAALQPAASTSIFAAACSGAMPAKPLEESREPHAAAVEEVAIADEEDELLAAAAADSAPEGAAGATPARALPGCSTAWSLEVLDTAHGDLSHPAKRLRLNGE